VSGARPSDPVQSGLTERLERVADDLVAEVPPAPRRAARRAPAKPYKRRLREVVVIDGKHVDIRRELLKTADLCTLDCGILQWIHHRHGHKRTPSLLELSTLFDTSKGTVSKARKRLREKGWIDERNRPARPLPIPANYKPGKTPSFVRVHFEAIRLYGWNHALTAAQLETMYAVEKARTKDHDTMCPSGLLAKMLGRKPEPGVRARRGRKTFQQHFTQLEQGDHARHRLQLRRFQRGAVESEPVRMPIIKREYKQGEKPIFRFVSQREREALRVTTRPSPFSVKLNPELRDNLMTGSDFVLQTLKKRGPPS